MSYKINLLTLLVFIINCENAFSFSQNMDSDTDGNTVTFILGDDISTENRFYSMAEEYFRQEMKNSERIISYLHSITEVITYLDQNAPLQGAFWDKVNIVSHTSPFSFGFSINGEKANTTSERLREYLKRNAKNQNPIRHVSKDTLITLWGCSAGRNQSLLAQLRLLFRGQNGYAKLRSPSNRIFFHQQKMREKIDKFYVKEYTIFAGMLDKPLLDYAEKFEKKYPNANIDWSLALRKEYYSGYAPFYSIYPLDISINTDKKILREYRTLHQFMKRQPEVKKILSPYQLTYRDIDFYLDDKPTQNRMITVLGRGNWLSVLQRSDSINDDRTMVYAHSEKDN